MSRLRPPVAFRSLAIHRGVEAARPAAPQSPGAVQAHPAQRSFSALLGRGGTAPPRLSMRLPPEAGPAPQEGALAHLLRDGDGDEGDGTDDGADPASAADDDPAGWADDLIPTPEHLASLLAQAAPLARQRAAAAPPRIRALAATIGGFCNEGAVSDSEGWNVHIQLRPDVLADTTLDLAVSSHWLQLRFHAGRPASRQLLCEHEATLRELLAATLDRSRDIAITID